MYPFHLINLKFSKQTPQARRNKKTDTKQSSSFTIFSCFFLSFVLFLVKTVAEQSIYHVCPLHIIERVELYKLYN